ncbi:unannotated protein [freshwater metagenome]|uniref:Unannotated protein n=1 Tax=freshwater metagenome TaxID=449393 RepID=A0A6J6F059_9ZZZZ
MKVGGRSTVAMPRTTSTVATKSVGNADRSPAAVSPSGRPSANAASTCGATAGLNSMRLIGTSCAPAT